MSPASKSKSKDRKAGKEPPKGSLKPSLHINSSSGAPASGYNPLSGTFHTFDTSPIPTSSQLPTNTRFRNMDDPDDPNPSLNGTEYDSISNNGSWSGESEDHREKPPLPPHPRPELPVPGADNDKREKIRLKNERKHQRQKERRAQELHERCTGYLMSRKLEALSQQLVSMGFPQERAMMALILNEGRVEESVAWLFEEDNNNRQEAQSLYNGSGGNLKIDISEELARIAEMEVRYKASKQEVERAVVSCEGDLQRADEMLRSQKEEEQLPAKLEQGIIGDPPTVANNVKQQPGPPVNQNPIRIQAKPTVPVAAQQKREEKDFNYTKPPPTVGPPADPGTKNVQVLKVPPKPDWTKSQQVPAPTEKRWTGASASVGSHNNNNTNNTNNNSNPSTSFPLSSSPLLASLPPAKTEPPRFLAVGNELKNLQLGSVKEPVMVMQRPQQPISTAKQAPPQSSSTSLGTTAGWYSNTVETLRPNRLDPSFAVARAVNPEIVSSDPMYSQFHYQQQQQQQYVSNSRGLAAASSLGLFSGVGTNGGPSGSVDWKTGGSILHCDYANVDWSLDRGLLPQRPNGLWPGTSYPVQNNGYGVSDISVTREEEQALGGDQFSDHRRSDTGFALGDDQQEGETLEAAHFHE
ncbi:Ubiquitin-associated/translation elongation factor EF1B protein [Striga hermonthica]|uniref:Ubiquitin-associated/translation elongation factor EF1B protein n=1 Tax=Striga hermonthica TaxID=68872 RepID=A0A9N7N3K1_STRHE|nr:Ubiquitin-associated/translation elongation factor EF1B protein [Striga hermonthica]